MQNNNFVIALLVSEIIENRAAYYSTTLINN